MAVLHSHGSKLFNKNIVCKEIFKIWKQTKPPRHPKSSILHCNIELHTSSYCIYIHSKKIFKLLIYLLERIHCVLFTESRIFVFILDEFHTKHMMCNPLHLSEEVYFLFNNYQITPALYQTTMEIKF